MRIPPWVWIIVVAAACAIPTSVYFTFTRHRREPTTRQGIILLTLSLLVVALIFGLIHFDDQPQP